MGLLVLSRHRDEAITIGDDVRVIVVDVRGGKVRLGIEAPPSMPVHRQEVYDAIHQDRQAKGIASGYSVNQVFGVVLMHHNDDSDRRVTVLETPSQDAAIAKVRQAFNSMAFSIDQASVKCFGAVSDYSRDEAAKWMFAKWVDHHESFRCA